MIQGIAVRGSSTATKDGLSAIIIPFLACEGGALASSTP